MRPEEFLEAARYLTEHRETTPGAGAAHVRSAISRTWYAVLHVGLIFLKDLSFEPPSGGAKHEWVIKLLRNSSDIGLQSISEQMRALLTLRGIADYNLIVRGAQTEAEQLSVAKMWLQQAQEMITALRACTDKGRLDKIKDAIQKIEDIRTGRYTPNS